MPGTLVLRNHPEQAAIFFDPLAVAIHAVERIANLPVAATVAIQGAGAIGIAALVAARERGANRIITIGAPESRLSLARDFGADVTIDIEQDVTAGQIVQLYQVPANRWLVVFAYAAMDDLDLVENLGGVQTMRIRYPWGAALHGDGIYWGGGVGSLVAFRPGSLVEIVNDTASDIQDAQVHLGGFLVEP